MSVNAPASGLFASLCRMLGTALEMAQVRLQLLGTEVEREKRRLFDSLLLAMLALLLLGVSLMLLCGFVILLVADAYRLMVLGLIGLALLFAGLLLLRAARQALRSPGGLFNTSTSELARDRSALQMQNQDATL